MATSMDLDVSTGLTPDKQDRLAIDLARSELRLIRDLTAVRQQRGLKPAELARRMGVDRSVITRFEAGGTNPTIATINRYAEAVGAMIAYSVTDLMSLVQVVREPKPLAVGKRDQRPDMVITVDGVEVLIEVKAFNESPQSLYGLARGDTSVAAQELRAFGLATS